MAWALIGVVLGGGGCEWTSTDGENAWSDAYAWVDFSGVYRSVDGRPIVVGGDIPGSSPYVQTSNLGRTGDGVMNYSGRLSSRSPIVAGSVSIHLGTVVAFADNGTGGLVQVGPGGGTGSINYITGAWAVVANGVTIPPDQTIYGTYQVTGTMGTARPGNTGNAVMHFTVNQTGNRLAMTDNRGMRFSGQVTGSSGVAAQTAAGSVRLVFDVTSADGTVRINGAFMGDWSGAAADRAGTLANRRMEGTWIEDAMQGSINALSGPTTIALTPAPTTPTPPASP